MALLPPFAFSFVLEKSDLLSRSHRLSTSAFAVAFREGRVLRHPLLQVRVFWRGDGQQVVRAAFVSPKKLGKAAHRNRLRRRARERFRLSNALDDPRLMGCDFLFFVGAGVQGATPDELDAALGNVLSRAQRIVGELRNEKKTEKRPETAGEARSSETE